jgi:hypothetical protein
MFRYKLRTLLIVLAVGPPVLAAILGTVIEYGWETIERHGLLLVSI